MCSKESNLFVLLFSRENSVLHTNQPTLSINLFCCGEYSEIERRKIAQNKFHASACEIFNVTVLTQLAAIALAAQFEAALFLKTIKTLNSAVFPRTSRVLTTESRMIIVIIIVIIITNIVIILFVLTTLKSFPTTPSSKEERIQNHKVGTRRSYEQVVPVIIAQKSSYSDLVSAFSKES